MLRKVLAGAKSVFAAIGGALLVVLAGVGALCVICRRPDRKWRKILEQLDERQADRIERADREKRLAGEEAGHLVDREKQFDQAEQTRHKLVTGSLVVLLALATALAGVARAAEPVTGPYVPEDYATLRQYYLATWDLSERYRGLYLAAEQSVKDLQASNARLLAIIEEQRQEIERLKKPGLEFGVVGGGLWTPAGPGVFAGGVVTF